ncbi:MAG TPA: PAS domain S-box protein, partial [Candidatus Paceibacterota bacterium]|nr:PAS domain S-box protein [Candidatus Paceibacterota bacterium]
VTADGTVSERPSAASFSIASPVWQRWWFLVLAFLFVGGAIFVLDRYRVAKTRQVQTALARSIESESRFRTLAETASDAIITIEEDSTIVFVNEAVDRVFGYAPSEILGKKLTSLMPERMRGAHDAGLARYVQTSSKNIGWNGVSLPGLKKDGTEVPLELSFGEFELDGKRYFTGIARDITKRLEAEAEIRKAREERMRELQRVRSRIATDLHDDIGSSLTQIAVLSEVARGQASALNADGVSTPLERIKNVSKELVAVMSDIVWAINPQKDYLNDLVQRMRRFGSDMLSGHGIAFEFKAPEMDASVELGANIRREVFAIFKESINNAVKYSGCSHVVTDFLFEDDRLIMTVADDGVGFDTSVVLSENFRPDMGGNGLVSIRRRSVELGGTCDIRSAPGAGTVIALSIPLSSHRNGGRP